MNICVLLQFALLAAMSDHAWEVIAHGLSDYDAIGQLLDNRSRGHAVLGEMSDGKTVECLTVHAIYAGNSPLACLSACSFQETLTGFKWLVGLIGTGSV